MILEYLKQRNKDPSVNPFLRLMDMDQTSPSIFFMMDEVGDMQILRKYDWSEELPVYCGTYEVLHKTELYRKFCLIMRRIRDESRVPPAHAMLSDEEMQSLIVMEYYPGTQGRIFMRGLSEAAMQQIVDEYLKIQARRQRRKRLPGKSGVSNNK